MPLASCPGRSRVGASSRRGFAAVVEADHHLAPHAGEEVLIDLFLSQRLAIDRGELHLALPRPVLQQEHWLQVQLQALQQTRGRADMPQLIAAGEAVGVPQLLGQLECELRSRAGSLAETNARVQLCDVLEAEASVASLHRAFLSGSNPNPELLRFTALDAFAAACEASERGGKLRAT